MYFICKIFFFNIFFFITISNIVYSNQISGKELKNLIIEKLSKNGFKSNPSINDNKIFNDCHKPFDIKPKFGNWKTVEITCDDNDHFNYVVRTNIFFTNSINSLKIKFPNYRKVIALSKSMQAGEIIQKDDITLLDKKNKNYGNGIFFLPEKIIGKKLKSSLTAGTIIRSRHLVKEWLIEKNQTVTIENKLHGIIITANGIAEESGQLGDRIIVRNINSGKKISGWIENEKKIRINAKIN